MTCPPPAGPHPVRRLSGWWLARGVRRPLRWVALGLAVGPASACGFDAPPGAEDVAGEFELVALDGVKLPAPLPTVAGGTCDRTVVLQGDDRYDFEMLLAPVGSDCPVLDVYEDRLGFWTLEGRTIRLRSRVGALMRLQGRLLFAGDDVILGRWSDEFTFGQPIELVFRRR